MLGSFTSPIEIGTDPQSFLWMFPLLAAISLIYKATKMRVLFWGKFFKEVAKIFITVSVFMALAAVGLHLIVYLLTS